MRVNRLIESELLDPSAAIFVVALSISQKRDTEPEWFPFLLAKKGKIVLRQLMNGNSNIRIGRKLRNGFKPDFQSSISK